MSLRTVGGDDEQSSNQAINLRTVGGDDDALVLARGHAKRQELRLRQHPRALGPVADRAAHHQVLVVR
eukprot:3370837-Prymnesium_polylepis.2